jgi:hypothetical protein
VSVREHSQYWLCMVDKFIELIAVQ